MSAGVDASPGRSQRLIELIRRRMGDAMVIYADANGSYNARQAIEVGRMLEDHGVALFEEPCPWEEYDQTRAVAQALGINVGGGEQDSSWPRWREMIDNRIVDVAQPDVLYNGGLLRTRRVTDHAASAGLTATPHSPKTGPWAAAMLALVSSLRNPNDYHEWRDSDDPWPAWCSPACGVKGGSVTVPSGAGLGVDYDPQFVAQMRVV